MIKHLSQLVDLVKESPETRVAIEALQELEGFPGLKKDIPKGVKLEEGEIILNVPDV